MQVYYSFNLPFGIDYWQHGNLVLLHYIQGIIGRSVFPLSSRVFSHDILHRKIGDGSPGYHHSSDIAVGDDAAELILVVDHQNCTQPTVVYRLER